MQVESLQGERRRFALLWRARAAAQPLHSTGAVSNRCVSLEDVAKSQKDGARFTVSDSLVRDLLLGAFARSASSLSSFRTFSSLLQAIGLALDRNDL